MSVVDIKPATNVDLEDIVARSAVKDLPGSKRQLQRWLNMSIMAWTGSIDGQVACIWGVVAPSVLSESAYLWLLTTDLIDQRPFLFVRHSQIVMKDILLKEFPCIRGQVLKGSRRSIRWLKWLGVRIKKTSSESKFLDFELRRA